MKTPCTLGQSVRSDVVLFPSETETYATMCTCLHWMEPFGEATV